MVLLDWDHLIYVDLLAPELVVDEHYLIIKKLFFVLCGSY